MTCLVCTIEIPKHPRITYRQYEKQKFCSYQCKGVWQARNSIGENNPNYKHGNSSLRELFNGSARYKHWRRGVFTRDNYTCQSCFQRGGNLEAHHIKPFCQFPQLTYDLNNGQTLCVDCHKQITQWFFQTQLIKTALSSTAKR
jgi:5-methylcytosine-specific restriction endonuclease McrA